MGSTRIFTTSLQVGKKSVSEKEQSKALVGMAKSVDELNEEKEEREEEQIGWERKRKQISKE